MYNNVPFALPFIGEEEISSVTDVLRSNWLTSGPKVKQFEQEFLKFIDQSCNRYAVAVNSATAGLHLALEAIGVGVGDKVLTTPYTFTATAEVIHYLGAEVVFIDIDPYTFNIDLRNIKRKLNGIENIKAIMPVHFAGQACEMDEITELAQAYRWKIIEDAAHALPATYKNRIIGAMGDISIFSFYATKPITTGEGGMIVTDNKEYAQRMKTMRLHGINRDIFDRYVSIDSSWYYEVVSPGYKYNMTDIAAAIGICQLKKSYFFLSRRQEIANKYTEAFIDLPLKIPFVKYANDIHSYHLYVIQLELEKITIDRDMFVHLMREKGIGVSVHFIPLHIQPFYKNKYKLSPDDFPVSLEVYKRSVSLPIYPKMTDCDVQCVIFSVKRILEKHLRRF